MGLQLSFTSDNVKKNPYDYPKLKLANGERALLTIVQNPFTEYVHNLQKPVLDDQNQVVMSTKERADGTEYQVPKLTFVSNPICLGDAEVLEEDGIDPANCPMCLRAVEDKYMRPKRRFAMHVIRTNTRPNSFDPVEPASHSLVIWAFTDNIFGKLASYQEKWGLDKHDLELGPCTDATFQKADLNVSPKTVLTDEIKAAVFSEKNRAEDPTVFCGMRKSRAAIDADLAAIDAQWAKAEGKTDADSEAIRSTESLSSGIDALLSDEPKAETPKAEAAPAAEGEKSLSLDDLPAAKKEEPAKAAPAPAGDSLDDILNGL